jgi:sugar phosphate isomerase/epimerase
VSTGGKVGSKRASQIGNKIRFKLGVLDRSLGLPGDPQAVAWAAELLFQGLAVSVGTSTTLLDRAVQKRYRDDARRGKIALATLALDATEPGALEALLTRTLPVARALGVSLVRVPFAGAGQTEAEREFMTYLLGKVAPAAERAGVTLGLGSSLPAREAVALVGPGSKVVKISYDLGAATRAKLDVADELRWLSDNKKLAEVYLREASGYLGKGGLDLAAVVATLANVGFDRWVHLATDAPSGDPEADTLENQRTLRGVINAHDGA